MRFFAVFRDEIAKSFIEVAVLLMRFLNIYFLSREDYENCGCRSPYEIPKFPEPTISINVFWVAVLLMRFGGDRFGIENCVSQSCRSPYEILT